MKKMMLTAVVSLFAACGGAPVEENTGESQEAVGGGSGYCKATLQGGTYKTNGQCVKSGYCSLPHAGCPIGALVDFPISMCGGSVDSKRPCTY